MPFRKGLQWEDRIKIAVQDRGLEWYSAFVMVWWGITLAIPGDTLAGPYFSAFNRFPWMTEAFWAGAFGLIGGARLTALWINGHQITRTPYLRMAGALFGAVSWAQIAFLLLDGSMHTTGTPGTGVGAYGLLALADLFSIFRAAHDARYHDS
jgi:hypothetical protein